MAKKAYLDLTHNNWVIFNIQIFNEPIDWHHKAYIVALLVGDYKYKKEDSLSPLQII